ncbi:hypothetical protein ES707_10121 [subsurface metagenome]
MAKIVSSSQRLVTAGINPGSMYSRIVSCRLTMAAPFTYKFTYTPVVAANLWLLGIDVWFCCASETDESIDWGIGSGRKAPLTYASYADNYPSIMQVTERDQPVPWSTECRDRNFHWSLRQRLEGEPRQFGLWAFSGGPTVFYIYASFEISEG